MARCSPNLARARGEFQAARFQRFTPELIHDETGEAPINLAPHRQHVAKASAGLGLQPMGLLVDDHGDAVHR